MVIHTGPKILAAQYTPDNENPALEWLIIICHAVPEPKPKQQPIPKPHP